LEANLKFAVPLRDGYAVESVLYGHGALCISSQVGCAVGCPFCASGARGLIRNLGPDELSQQVDAVRMRGYALRRITVSGIGEPLHNRRNLEIFLNRSRKERLPVSVTTTGSPLRDLPWLLHQHHNGVMISLHAASAELHRKLIPLGPSFNALWDLLREEWPLLSTRRQKKVGINYLLLEGVNDSDDQMERLSTLLRPFPEMTLHLLTCNPVSGRNWRSPNPPRIKEVFRMFKERGCNVRTANNSRQKAEGGCGTLLLLQSDGHCVLPVPG